MVYIGPMRRMRSGLYTILHKCIFDHRGREFFPEPKSFGSADLAGGGPGRLRGAGDRRNDGGIDGRRRLTGQSPTATAEPIDKGRQRADRLRSR